MPELLRGTIVECQVVAHRGRFGVDVEITAQSAGVQAFIDFVLLPGRDGNVAPTCFPVVGTKVDAVVVAYMPNGELRLDARPEVIAKWRPA